MTDWRQTLCGTLPLSPALAGERPALDLQALKQMSERMSCGGVYMPNWQHHLLPETSGEAKPTTWSKLVHLIGQEKNRTDVLLITEQARAASRIPASSPLSIPAALESASANTSAMLREIDNLWHKN